MTAPSSPAERMVYVERTTREGEGAHAPRRDFAKVAVWTLASVFTVVFWSAIVWVVGML